MNSMVRWRDKGTVNAGDGDYGSGGKNETIERGEGARENGRTRWVAKTRKQKKRGKRIADGMSRSERIGKASEAV